MAKKKNFRPKKKAAGKADPKPRPKKLNTRTIRNSTLRGAIPLKKLPDPVKLGQLADLAAAAPRVRLGGADSGTLTSVLEAKTHDQSALELCGKWYERFKELNPHVLETVASMVGLRRAYTVAYRELTEAIEAGQLTLDGQKQGEEIPPEFADFCVQYAMWLASKPFNEHDMMEGITGTILPWIATVVDKHTEADQAEAVAERAELNERRRKTNLPVGLKHSPAQEDDTLGRDRALVLVGWKNAVQWLMDEMLGKVLLDKEYAFQVVRMLTKAPRPGDQSARLVRLAPSAWGGCANSDRDIDKMVALFIDPTVGGPVDLVAVDDLSAAHTAGFVGRNRFAQAGDAHRRLKKWCDKMGAGLVAAVPLDAPELPDMAGPEFEQLKTFAYLRPVSVRDGEGDHYVVTVGTDATVFLVPKHTLDAYGPATLVVPEGVTQ